MSRIFGVQSMEVRKSWDEVTSITLSLVAHPDYDPKELYDAKWDSMFPGNVIVKCGHCGQWGASKCACRYCGAPID